MSDSQQTYHPSYLLRNGHLNTIYPTLFRASSDLPYVRKRITTPDNDFLDIDMLEGNHKKIVILCHGLEGSSNSKYIKGIASLLHRNAWDVAAMNYRTCSGEMNKQIRVYHSGATDDLQHVIDSIIDDYDEVSLVGFSLGGNLSLVYAGEQGKGISSKIKSIATVSVPTNLHDASIEILKKTNIIYHQKFLRSLRKKVKLKSSKFPEIFNEEKLEQVKTLYDFDDIFTGPIGGFKDAKDYYKKCSSAQFIPKIEVPTLVINALDDPFLPDSCYPNDEVAANDCVEMLTPKYGGHVGFVQRNKPAYWSEERILDFLSKYATV